MVTKMHNATGVQCTKCPIPCTTVHIFYKENKKLCVFVVFEKSPCFDILFLLTRGVLCSTIKDCDESQRSRYLTVEE